MYRRSILLIIFISLFVSSFSQTRKVAVLDLTVRNSESNFSRIRSCIQIMNVAGVPYDTTSSVTTALTYPIVFITPIIYSTTFTAQERTDLTNYVSNGGVIIASSMRDPLLYPIFGVSNNTNSYHRNFLNFNTSIFPELYHYIDDSLEKQVVLGNPSDTGTFNTRDYNVTTATVLAQYEDNSNGVLTNSFGSGRTYLFGMDLRDVINRYEMIPDNDIARAYSNGFEPTSDVFCFIISNIIRKHIPNTVRLHTSPYCTTASILISHDMDSHTAVDTMHFFVDLENSRNIKASYLITTRYFNDGWIDSFYCFAHNPILYVMSKGGVLGSHSVGHFLDFDVDSTFPLGNIGNTKQNYNPAYSTTNMFTTGGTVMGETEVSQKILLNDFGVNIKTFRAGFLNYNDRIPKALQTLGYKYNSTFSANNVMCDFPYPAIDGLQFSGVQENVLEIPMTISDVFESAPMNDTNYLQKIPKWISSSRKNIANHAPVIMLIHPNRQYKVTAEQMWLDSMPGNLFISNIDAYGDFWSARDSMDFYTVKNNNVLSVYLNTNTPNSQLSFIIDDADSLSNVIFYTPNGQQLVFNASNFDDNSKIYCNPSVLTAVPKENKNDVITSVYPNPANDIVNIELTGHLPNGCELKIVNVLGETVYTEKLNPNPNNEIKIKWKPTSDNAAGCYFYSVTGMSALVQGKIILYK